MRQRFSIIKHPLVYVLSIGYVNGEYLMVFEDANLTPHVMTFDQAKLIEDQHAKSQILRCNR
jgi:hypothetical protein